MLVLLREANSIRTLNHVIDGENEVKLLVQREVTQGASPIC